MVFAPIIITLRLKALVAQYLQTSNHCHLSADVRLLAADELLEVEQREGESNVVLQVLGRSQAKLALVALVLLNVQTDRGTAAAGAGQTDDDTAAIIELSVQALVLGHAAVQVGVGEVAHIGDLAAGHGGTDEAVLVGDLVR